MIARTQRIETLRQHSLVTPAKGIRSDEGRLLFVRELAEAPVRFQQNPAPGPC